MSISAVQVIGNAVIGGSEMHLVSLVEGLTRAGADVPLVVVPGKGPLTRILRQRGIPFRAVDIGTGDQDTEVDEAAVTQLVELFTELKPDVVHAHLYPAQLHATLAAALAGLPAVTTLHRLEPMRPGSVILPLLTGASTIAVCQAVGDVLVQHGVEPGQVHVIYNAVAGERLQPDPVRARAVRESIAGSARHVVGSVARLSPEKGVDVLLRALPYLRLRYPEIRVPIAGYGPSAYQLKRLAGELGVDDLALFLNTREDVHQLNQAFDVFVLASQSEACPLALLDAMAVGAACVATCVGGVPEILDDGVNGLLVEPDHPEALALKIGTLLDDEGLRVRLGKAAANTVRERFTMERMVAQTKALYRELAGTRVEDPDELAERRRKLPGIIRSLDAARTATGSLAERIAAAGVQPAVPAAAS